MGVGWKKSDIANYPVRLRKALQWILLTNYVDLPV